MTSRVAISWSTQVLATEGNGDLASESAEHVLAFDAVLSETHDYSATLTEHAIERGANRSDHKIPSRDRLSLEVEVTNTPIGAPPPSGLGPDQGPSGRREKTAAGATALVFSESFDRLSDVMYVLRQLAREPIVVTIETSKRTYERMAIVSVSIPRNAPEDAYRFIVDAEEYLEVETRTTETPQPREPRGRRTENSGTQETEDEGDEVGRLQSLAAQGLDGEGPLGYLGGLFE